MHPPLLAALDKFVKEQDGVLTRPEGVRLLLVRALADSGYLPRGDGEDRADAQGARAPGGPANQGRQ
jgi:hypothetical protein